MNEQKGMSLKLDLEKAYGKTDRDFLNYVRPEKDLILFVGNGFMDVSLWPTLQ